MKISPLRQPSKKELMSAAVIASIALIAACSSGTETGVSSPTKMNAEPSLAIATDSPWGPMAVVEGGYLAGKPALAGTVAIDGSCVTLHSASETYQLVWQDVFTHWDAEADLIQFRAPQESPPIVVKDGSKMFVSGFVGEPGDLARWSWVNELDEGCEGKTFLVLNLSPEGPGDHSKVDSGHLPAASGCRPNQAFSAPSSPSTTWLALKPSVEPDS